MRLNGYEVKNFTPHKVVIENENGKWEIEPEVAGGARIDFESQEVTEVAGFPVTKKVMVGHTLPEPQEGVILIVSALMLPIREAEGRDDLFAPDTDRAKRNEKGWVLSVPGLTIGEGK